MVTLDSLLENKISASRAWRCPERLLNSSSLALYGSSLWDLFSKDSERLYTSFNVALRNILKLDRCSHSYMLEPLSETPHLKTLLAGRFVSFHEALLNSTKFPVRFLARLYGTDLRTVHGRNLERIASLCNCRLGQLSSKIVKSKLRYMTTPKDESWRVSLGIELLKVREDKEFGLPGFNSDEIDQLLTYVCIS